MKAPYGRYMTIFRTLLLLTAAYALLFDFGTEAEGAGMWSQAKAPLNERIKEGAIFEDQETSVQIPVEKGELTTLNKYRTTARILSRKDYWLGRESAISKMDLVLGWNDLSMPENAIKIDFTQMGRFYIFPEAAYETPHHIRTNTANIHVVPANKDIERKMEFATPGKIIEITGQLVNYVQEPNLVGKSFTWISSTSTGDKGYYSSEIVYVEDVKIH